MPVVAVPGRLGDPLTEWRCRAAPPGRFAGPAELPADDDPGWLAATVPGTAAAALREAGLDPLARDLDAEDWWFRTRFARPPGGGPWLLRLGGLATIADVWLDGEPVLHSEDMFTPADVPVPRLAERGELVIRFAALEPVLAQRRPRPRWKVARLRNQRLRWIRTSLLGRLTGWVPTPPAVGPWRPVELLEITDAPVLVERRLLARCVPAGPGDPADTADPAGAAGVGGAADTGGTVEFDGRIAGAAWSGQPVRLHVGDASADLQVSAEGADTRVRGRVRLAAVERWWPHTHGAQPRYPVRLSVAKHELALGSVAFREIAVDRSGDGFALSVNGVPVFCRGAYWTPLDPVGLREDPAGLRAALGQVRDANLNMIRVGGETVYPGPVLLDLLDELGILLWQDAMFAFYDVPDSPEFLAGVRAELTAALAGLAAHPCLAVVSGGSEIEQQATLVGLPAERRVGPLHTVLADLVDRLAPGVPSVPSSPTGGALPVQPRHGVAHYYGVGAYLRPLEDARRAGVRFAAECLAFAVPPEPDTVGEVCGGATRAGHHPAWKAAVYRDAGASWDFEDVTAHYTAELFGVNPSRVRWTDPEHALDLARATVAHVHERTWAEWRRAGSACAGALVFHYRDLAPGAGLGLVDALGRPKAPWWVMRRALAPVAVLLTDEGLNGLDAHLVNDTAGPVTGTLRIELVAGERRTEVADTAVTVPARGAVSVDVAALFGDSCGFRDLTHAYLFGPPTHDAVLATLLDAAGGELARSVFVVAGPARAREPDLGLGGEFAADRADPADPADPADAAGRWQVTVRTRRFAQWVSLDVDGFTPADNWFHLAPGESREVSLWPRADAPDVPRGRVRALNQHRSVPIAAPPRSVP